MMNYNAEFEFILSFIKGWETDDGESIPNDEIFYHQLLSLWTAFCLRYRYVPDTSAYDSYFRELARTMDETFDTSNGYIPASIEDTDTYNEDNDAFDIFDLYMGQYLA